MFSFFSKKTKIQNAKLGPILESLEKFTQTNIIKKLDERLKEGVIKVSSKAVDPNIKRVILTTTIF
jgi:hypothetical protein